MNNMFQKIKEKWRKILIAFGIIGIVTIAGINQGQINQTMTDNQVIDMVVQQYGNKNFVNQHFRQGIIGIGSQKDISDLKEKTPTSIGNYKIQINSKTLHIDLGDGNYIDQTLVGASNKIGTISSNEIRYLDSVNGINSVLSFQKRPTHQWHQVL